MSWEARKAAQRKAIEDAKKEKQETEDGKKKAAADEKERRQAIHAQMVDEVTAKITVSEAYRALIELTDSDEFKAVVADIQTYLIPRVKLRRGFLGRPIQDTWWRTEVLYQDTFNPHGQTFSKDIVITLYKATGNNSKEVVAANVCMKLTTDGAKNKYAVSLGGIRTWDQWDNSWYEEHWFEADSSDTFLDYLAAGLEKGDLHVNRFTK